MRRPVPFQPIYREARSLQPTGIGVDWAAPINRDLRGYWPFNEGSGSAAFDIAFQNKATLGTGQTWVTGLSCSGSNSNATVAAAPAINIVGKFSGAVWVYPKVSNVYQVLFSRSSGGIGTDRQYSFLLSGAGTGKLWIALGGTDIGDVNVSPGWTVNKWNHLVLTADGTNARLYINRILANTTATVKVPTSQPTYPLVFGAEGTGFPLNGILGSEQFFNRVLTQADIDRLYTERSVGIITPRRRLWVGVASGAGVTGTIASTEANDVLAATGSVQTVGTIATTEAADVLAASGFLSFTGTIATTEAKDTLAATGKVLITGTAPLVESADVLAAAGTVSQPARTGTIALVEAGDTFAATGPPAVGVQVLNYGVWRRRREEYEAQRREEEQIAHDLAAAIDEGLPEPLKPADEPEPTPPGSEELEAASLALSRASAALTIDETVAARIAAAVEAKVRSVAPRIVPQATIGAIVTALSDYDDDEEAVLALLLAA